jgi:hypothetical protein
LDISCLQIAVNYLAAICGTTRALPITPAPVTLTLGSTSNSSALTCSEVSELVSEAEGSRSSKITATPEEYVSGTYNWSEINQREYSAEEAVLAAEYLMVLFPRSALDEADIVLMADVALDSQARYPNPAPEHTWDYYADSVAESHTVRRMKEYLD